MMTFKIFSEHRLVFIRNIGETPVEEFIQCLRAIRTHPDWRPGYDALTDLTRATTSYTMGEFFKISCEAVRGVDPHHSAIVASEDFVFGQSRMYEITAMDEGELARYGVFRDWGEALQWVGRDESLAETLRKEESPCH